MKLLQRYLEDPIRFRRLRRLFYAWLALVLGAELLLPRWLEGAHPHFAFESIPAWNSLYGLLSCVLIIVVSKFLGKLWLMRREDYYER